jgi:hypothetical protein
MGDGFTIRIFVADGDPDGIRVIDRMNWTGRVIVFPRGLWPKVSQRSEFSGPGVYMLVGTDPEADSDLPHLYIGQAEVVRSRLESHDANKEFWNRGIIFVSTNHGLHRGHIVWLEARLIARAKSIGQATLDNSNVPQEPSLPEADRADTEVFMREMLQILPIVGVRAFEEPLPVAIPGLSKAANSLGAFEEVTDTIVVPAQSEGFQNVFLGKNQWYSIRISGGMLKKIRYIAGYQTAPISAVTHFAPVERIEPHGDDKYRLVFSAPAKELGPIPFADAAQGTMQGPRYTSSKRLFAAKKLSDLFV